MIHTELEEVKFYNTLDPISFPVYSDAEISVSYSPSWVEYSIDSISANKSQVTITPFKVENGQLYDVIVLTEGTSTIRVPVIYDFDSSTLSVREIIDNILVQSQEGSYYDGIERSTLTMLAKSGLQHMSIMSEGEVRRCEAKLDDVGQLNTPFDMVSFISLSGIDKNGHLHKLYESKNLNTGVHNYIELPSLDLVEDSEGYAVTGSGVGDNVNLTEEENIMSYHNLHERRSMSLARSVKGGQRTQAGQYYYDKTLRKFSVFATPYENFLIEYNSDPMVRSQIKSSIDDLRISKYYEEPLSNWIYWKWVERRKDVPRSEVMRAKQEWGQSERLARRASMNTAALLQSLKSNIG